MCAQPLSGSELESFFGFSSLLAFVLPVADVAQRHDRAVHEGDRALALGFLGVVPAGALLRTEPLATVLLVEEALQDGGGALGVAGQITATALG